MFDSLPSRCDVIIIGAGPAAAAMASSLTAAGIAPLIIERDQFPRFTIGESLLPEAINCLEAVDLLTAVQAAGFQYKDGALFTTNSQQYAIKFADGRSAGKDYAYQVTRADFDLLLMQQCIARGASVCYRTQVVDIARHATGYALTLESNGERRDIHATFLVDASGFGRVLARKFKLDTPSGIEAKSAMFSHIEADINPKQFDRNKILIAQTDVESDSWYWLIPFCGGLCSAGVVTPPMPANDAHHIEGAHKLEGEFRARIAEQPLMQAVLGGRKLRRPVTSISAYSSSIARLYGDGYVILGNAGEFIDPIFSSGVTIALKSALMAAPLVIETIKNGAQPDWHGRFQAPLMAGIDTFREYVKAWYAGSLPKLFYAEKDDKNYPMICSILAGYVWDRSNPFTKMTAEKLDALLVFSQARE